jgi:CubicO group peptidase (beta-lactamase class C family)
MSPESVALVERRLIPLFENLQQPTVIRRNFVEENMTPSVIEQVGVDGLVQAMARLSEQLGAFRVTGVTHTPGYLRARVELLDRGTTMALVLPLGPAPDYLIDGLLLAADDTAMAATPEATEETLTEVLSEFVNGQAADGFAGAVLVARGGDVAYAGAFGPADPDGLDINTMLVPFNIGPITELLTTVMALSLAEAEILDLEATIGSYLPDLPQESLREAQVGDLLTHVSGLGPLVAGSPDSLDGLPAYLAAVRRMEPTASPGMEFQHSEANTILLAAIAERASGETYATLMRERVYQPAGMTGSGHFNRDEVYSCCAIGVMPDGSANLRELPQLGSPGAGSYATAIDLWHFSNALLQGELLSTGTFLRATSPAIIPAPNVAFGLGISIFDDEGETYIGATGRAPGMGADLAIYPASGYIVVVLSNTDGGARPLAVQLRRIVRPLMGEE